jgi:hypothetical protein
MATAFVNKHTTRVLAAGGTIADTAWLDSVDSWITSQGLYGNLFDWSSAGFGVVKNGSNQISKIMGLGTTWLPRLGDLTPSSPTNTTYSATAISSKPGWVNAASTAYSYYGSARSGSIRTNNIRRKHAQGWTVVGVYTKSGTAVASLMGYGNNPVCFYLQNTSGSPGSCKFAVGPVDGQGTVFADTHSTTLSNGVVNIIGGTFDRDKVLSYVEGVAGTGSAGYQTTNTGHAGYRPLLGAAGYNEANYAALYSGSSTSTLSYASASTVPSLAGTTNEALFSMAELIMFDTCLTPVQMASLNTLLRTRY